MAGENPGITPEGDKTLEIIELLRGIKSRLDGMAATLDGYKPALDKAAQLVDSPAARLARKIPGPRGRQPWQNAT